MRPQEALTPLSGTRFALAGCMKLAFNPIRLVAEVMLIVALAQTVITSGLPLLGLAAVGPRSTLPAPVSVLLPVLVAHSNAACRLPHPG